MKHIALLAYCCEQAEKDLQTGHGVGWKAVPVSVIVQAYPLVDEPGSYQVLAKANNQLGVLVKTSDEFLGRFLEHPEQVEGYISTLRDNAWKWAHSEDARSLALASNQEPV